MMTGKRRAKKGSLSNNYCVVAFNTTVKKISNPTLSQTLYIGTLVNVSSSLDSKRSAIRIVNYEGLYDVSEEEVWSCPKDALVHVDKSVWPLVSAVPSPVERVFLLREPGLSEQLSKIDVGTLVNVINSENDIKTSPAVVKYKGPILKKGPGIYFGVELLDESIEGDSDGCYGSQRLFSCPPGTGLFVAVNRLRLPTMSSSTTANKPPSVQQLKDKFEKMQKPSGFGSELNHFKSGGKVDYEPTPLKIGDRVVWISDDGPLAGLVKRVTMDDSHNLRVSVQFDEPVKSGYHPGLDIARTLLLPAIELVRASDFYGTPEEKQNHDWNYDGKENNRINNDLIAFTPPPSNDDAASSESDGSGLYDNAELPEPSPFCVGSVVEVTVRGEPHYGVIRWIGTVPGDKRPRRVAGIEMEEEHLGLGDGVFNGRRYFQCNPQRALFVNLSQCRADSRFQDSLPHVSHKPEDFGGIDSPIIEGRVRPVSKEGDVSTICGKYRGIQGHHNSCYLDATLFSMFTFTSVFDSLLYRPATARDIAQYEEVQRVLREEIVNPLRENLYVRADRIMKLRTLMERLSSVTGLTTEEKDPEEFLTSLVAQILRAEPFLKLSSGQEAYHYQLFVEKDEALILPTVQQLFEQSFLASDIKLKQVPSCLIIQMPRFGKSFKMYPRILPSQLLDVTDVIEDSPRQCTVCGKLAEYECKQCFDQCDVGLQSISFCARCLETAHSHERRRSHSWRALSVPAEFSVLKDHCVIPRLYMQLFAVVCIETSHYVTFVKCGTGSDAPWCFFDSMADRKGEQNGYNIPEMVACPNLPYWLSEKGAQTLQQIDERQLPEHAKRLLCDAYMCMYQSSEVMMYR